ncbi:hypothetical protein SAY87_002799 [Trapa incisa]|uniref:Uncharacterized protein n=1 Tax=Trapa incisa TaxID=236973 RepID=A0AAN7JTP4_9MYRT|nr:hypothetical protein SAY87_002799 [Trapa incisa]
MGCISVELTTVISSLDQSPPLDKEVRGMIHADRNETIQFAYFEFLNLMSINTKTGSLRLRWCFGCMQV